MAAHVSVMLSEQFGKAHYKNLRTCSCCASKISSRRAAEISIAGNVHVDAGGAMYRATCTFVILVKICLWCFLESERTLGVFWMRSIINGFDLL